MTTFTFPVEQSFELDNSDAAFMAAFTRTIAERGINYVYESPSYETTDRCVNIDREKKCGSCLIGTVLVNMGVPIEWFISRGFTDSDALRVLGALGFSNEIRASARAAQMCQDDKNDWGMASDKFFATYFDADRMNIIIHNF